MPAARSNRDLHDFLSITSRSLIGSQNEDQRRIPLCYGWWSGCGNNDFKLNPKHSILINNSPPSRETILPKPNPLRFSQSLPGLAEGKYPTSGPSSLLVSPKERERRLRSTSEGHRLTED